MKLDLSNKNLKKIDLSFLKQCLNSIEQLVNLTESDNYDDSVENSIQTVCLDNNCLSKLDNLDLFINLKNLSLANNRLVEIRLISKLINLQYINLLNNSLTSLEPFKDLKHLTWLNISGNQIKSLDSLKSNINLEYLDASENSISHLCDLKSLTRLNTLSLNGNEIHTLKHVPNSLPLSIKNLFLSYNAIEDLNEISYLTSLNCLENLCIDNNPCVAYSNGINYENMFNYRPYVINWCLNLKFLDGLGINQKEYLKAEWLYSQGKGRQFKPGQNSLLIEYLIKQCPFNSVNELDDDDQVRLTKILEKKELYSNTDVSILSSNTINSKKTNSNQSSDQSQKTLLNQVYSSSNDSVNNLGLKEFEFKKQFNYKINADMSDSDKEKNSKEDNNQNKWFEYENRPIKPLDPNAFYKKLSEFSEISNDELEEMKKKARINRVRSKTTDNAQVQKLPQQKNFTKTPMRQLSINSNNSPQQSSTKQTITNKLRKRSKTQDDLNLNKKLNTSQAKTVTKIRSNTNTPNKKGSLSQISSSSLLSPRKPLIKRKEQINLTPSKMNKNKNEIIKNDLKESIEIQTKEIKEIKETHDLTQISMEIHSKIQKQRQELRLQREKNFNIFKNQLKHLDQEKNDLNDIENYYINHKIQIPSKLTFEDRCATKIQAAYRGYLFRKSKQIKTKLIYLKYKHLQRNVNKLKNDLNHLKNAQFELIEFNKNTMSNLIDMIQKNHINNDIINYKSLIEPLPDTSELENNEKLKQENDLLKNKLKLLEEKLNTLTVKSSNINLNNKDLSTSDEPKLDIYPPLKVRLQKLNEKSVALKWNHNPKNILIELSAYNIYINDELCGTMKPTDTIAAINGIQEEGEYRIYIRSICAKIESVNSNCVVTRVKKKQTNIKKSDELSTSISESEEQTNDLKEELKTSKTNCSSNLSELSDRNNESIEKRLYSNLDQIGLKLFKSSSKIDIPKIESSIESLNSNDLYKPFSNLISESSSFIVDEKINENKNLLKENKFIKSKPPISPTEASSLTKMIKQKSFDNKQKDVVYGEKYKINNKATDELNLINNVKYSTSEPNLINKLSPLPFSSAIPRISMLRQSISFENESDNNNYDNDVNNDDNNDLDEKLKNEYLNKIDDFLLSEYKSLNQ